MSARPPIDPLLAPWRQICAKVDAFFSQVSEQHGDAMQCRRGCTLCCAQELSVMAVEALAVLQGVEALADDEARALAEGARADGPPCVFLRDGACCIYAHRPLICRSHGLPIRQQGEVACCELNFEQGPPPGSVLDGGWLTATLTIANGMLERELRLDELPRLRLRDLARRGRNALPPLLDQRLFGLAEGV